MKNITLLTLLFAVPAISSAQLKKLVKDKINQEVKNEVSNETNKVEDDGQTTETHKKNAGGIVFSTSKIEKENEKPETFQTTFKASDNIYGRWYLPQSLYNSPVYGSSGSASVNMDGWYEVRISVDGKDFEIFERANWNDLAIVQKTTTWQLMVNPTQEDVNEGLGGMWPDIVNKLTAGEHEIKFELWGFQGQFYTRNAICKGGFKLTKSAGENVRKGVDFSAIKPGMKDAALEQKMLDAVKKAGWSETPLKAVITDEDWTTVRHEITGEILSHVINARVAVKTTKGICRVFDLSFIQDYNGSSYSQATSLHGVGSSEDIECDTVK